MMFWHVTSAANKRRGQRVGVPDKRANGVIIELSIGTHRITARVKLDAGGCHLLRHPADLCEPYPCVEFLTGSPDHGLLIARNGDFIDVLLQTGVKVGSHITCVKFIQDVL